MLRTLIEAIRQRPGLGAYLVAGVLVAIVHMRQQRMTSSVKSDPLLTVAVVLLLAMMWPILLFAMLVNYLQPPPPSKRSKPPADTPPTDARSDVTPSDGPSP